MFGGVGTFVKDLAHGLEKLGMDVIVVSGKPVPWKLSEPINISKQDNITVIRLKYPNVIPRHVVFQLFNNDKFTHLLKKLKPDIIHGQSGSTFPAIFSLKKIAPVVVTFHGSPSIQRTLSFNSLTMGGTFGDFFTNGIGYPSWAFGYKREYQSANSCVAVSKSLMKQLNLELSDNRSKFHYIHNGIDLKMLDSLCADSVTNQSTEQTLVFGGRLFWNKGVIHLVELAYLLEKKYNLPLKVVIYGSGPMYGKIVQMKNKLGLKNIELRPFTNRSDFLFNVRRSMYVLLPSLYEGSPMLLLESMCLGKTPIMFNLPYSREFTDNGRYGILANNVDEMAQKIADNYLNASFVNVDEKILSYARRNFNVEKTALAYSEIYNAMS